MSALPGGAADKLGNRFEDWWTLLRIADVLQGRAARIRIEPPGKDGEGVEFWVDEPGLRWYEQVKNAQHSWTLKRLVSPRSSPGVLLAVSGHLAEGHQVRLVMSSAAHDLAALSSRARVVTSLDEYESILPGEQLAGFRMLTNAWEVPPATAWAYLRRVHVETYPQQNLRRLVHLQYEMLIQGDPEIVVNELRGWLDDMLHQEITAPMIWKHLRAKGFARRLLAGDPDTLQALSGTAERNHRRTERTRPTIMVSAPPRAARLVKRLLAADSKQVVVLHGRAGAGKSTVASDALRELADRGWLSAVVRMDNAGQAQTAVALGQAHELTASPAVLLAGAADGSPAVLLIDQLDAVSLYSGRMPDSFDAVAELIDQVESLPNIKVVMVVRWVDLKADQRMRSMVSDETRFEELELGDLATSQVRVALEEAGVATKDMAPATLDLLRVPLHLAVFSSLPQSAQKLAYRTLTDLYEQFTENIRLTIDREGGGLNWSGTVGALVRYMSEHECLVAPSVVVEDTRPSEMASLVSHGVVVKEQHGYAIFHETYFDFIFARSFVASGADLHDFLVSSGQRLFRRSQARQVLEYLAATDRHAFRQIVVRLLASTEIRPHLH